MRWTDSFRWNTIYLFFFLLLASATQAEQPNLEFRSLPTLENLTSNKITSLQQDSVGFLWIGTQEGLFRFDGQTVTPYFQNTDPNSLPSNSINRLFTDSHGTLWICTAEELCKFDPEYDNFTTVLSHSALKGVPTPGVNCIAESSAGEIYIAVGHTIYKYDISKDFFNKVLELDRGKINKFIFDEQGKIWIGASLDGGFYCFDPDKNHLTAFHKDPPTKNSLSGNEIFDLIRLKDKIWIATFGTGIDCFDPKSGTFRNYSSPNYFENFAMNTFADKKNNLWICTLGSLKLYDKQTDSFFNYYNQSSNPLSLGKSLAGLYQDNQGNYWTFHSPGGVKHISFENKFKHFNTNPEKFWYTSDKYITTISTDKSGNLWVGNFYNGIDVFRWQEHRVDRYLHKRGDESSLGNGTTFSIFRDSHDQMWIGTNMGGLQRFIPGTSKFETFRHDPQNPASISGNDVRSISEDRLGNLWLAVHGKGVDRFNRADKTFSHFNDEKNNLSNDYTFQVFNDSKGNLWVATAYGLSLLPQNETTFKQFTFDKEDSTSISSNLIQCIYEDQQHQIWIGTSNGLNKYLPEQNSFKRYVSHFKTRNICSVLSDMNNNLWLSTSSGISKFDPRTEKVINFDQEDGLLSSSYFPLSSYTADHRELFFGGTEGIVIFNPDSLNPITKAPRVVFTSLKLFNKSIDHKNSPNIVDKSTNYASEIRLDYQSNSIEIGYQALKLIRPDRTTYGYKLEGFDKEWIDAGTRREAAYNNLKPGRYTFLVRARYNNGEWGPHTASVKINVVPAWWMTLWFKIFAGIIVLAATFVIIHVRTRRLLAQREKLEKLVAERTSEIRLKNQMLNEMNSTKVKLFSIISHDLRSPFNSILGFQNLLIEEYDRLSDRERLEMLNQVHASTKQAFDLVENLLSWSRLQTNAIHYKPTAFGLNEVVFEKYDLYHSMAESKGIAFTVDIHENIRGFADLNLFRVTLRNLINNAIKFTGNDGSIQVSAFQQNGVISVVVSDSGIGMTKKQLDNLFHINEMKIQTGTGGEKGTGLGLLLCKEFVELNKGKLSIESIHGKGTTCSFTLPAYHEK